MTFIRFLICTCLMIISYRISFGNPITIQQPYFSFNKYDGLPSNLVYGCIFDNDGLLWACTDAGVIKFDGNSSLLLTKKEGLPSNDIYHLFCDSKNRIWFTSLGSEVSYYENGKVHNRFNDPVLKLLNTKSNFPRYFETDEGIWIDLSPLSLFCISNSKVTKYRLPAFEKGSFRTIPFDQDNLILVGEEFFIKLNIKTNKYTYKENKGEESYCSISRVRDKFITIDTRGVIKELSHSEIEKGVFLNVRNDRVFYLDSLILAIQPNGFDSYAGNHQFSNFQNFEFTSICLSKNNIWSGSFFNGLVNISSFQSNIILPKVNISCIYLFNEEIYCGTRNGEIIKISSNKSKSELFQLVPRNEVHKRIIKVSSNKNDLIVLSEIGMFKSSSNKRTVFSTIKIDDVPKGFKNFRILGSDTLLMNTLGIYFKSKSGFTKYERKKRFYSIDTFNNHRIIGTQDSLIDGDDSFKPFGPSSKMTHRYIDLVSNNGMLFASTSDSGIYVFNKFQIIKHLWTNNGMSSNNCGRIILFKNNLYVCTDNGISIIDLHNFTINNLFESDGLASNEVNDILINKDTLYTATSAGLSLIPLKLIPNKEAFNLFAKPYIANADTVWQKPQSITTRTNKDIVLVLNGVSYIKNTKKTYYYRIKELDSNFKATLDKNILLKFSNTGHFTFEAYCLNAEGTKSKFLVIPIYIKPYFYQTIWFYLALLALLLAIIFFVSRYYANLAKIKEQKKAAEEKRIRSLELAAWRSSVNPHFLFNSLNGLQAFFRQNEFDKGNFYLSSFTQMLRNTVDSSNDLAITVEEEIEFLRKYLEFEQNKREKIFNFIIDVDQPKTLDLYIPTLLVQQVLENCVKHAFLKHREGFVHIHFFIEDDKLVCTIRDNGPGLQVSQKQVRKSLGISLIRYKLRILEKILQEPTSFSMQNIVNQDGIVQGLETIFKFPILTKRLKIVEEVEEEQTDGKDTEHDDQHAEEQHAP